MHQLSSQGILGVASGSGLGAGASEGILGLHNQSDLNPGAASHAFVAHRGSGGPAALQPLQAPTFQSQGALAAMGG